MGDKLANPYFDPIKVFQITQNSYAELGLAPPSDSPKGYFFDEIVAQHLYEKWLANPEDTQIIEYSLPMVQTIMLRQQFRPMYTRVDSAEIFNALVLMLMQALPNYRLKKGKLYSYFTFLLLNRIKTIYNDLAQPGTLQIEAESAERIPDISGDGYRELLDLSIYLEKYIDLSSGSLREILMTLVVLLKSPDFLFPSRKNLETRICKKLNRKYPVALIGQILDFVVDRYRHDLLE